MPFELQKEKNFLKAWQYLSIVDGFRDPQIFSMILSLVTDEHPAQQGC